MSTALKVVVILACLGFVIALLQVLFGFKLAGIDAEAFSRASSNLALIAIAAAVCLKKDDQGSD